MKTLLKIAYKNLAQHLKWSIPTALSIFIAVALMTGIGTMISSYVKSIQNSIRNLEGPSHFVGYNLSENQIQQLNQLSEIESVEIIDVFSYAKIKDYELLNAQRPYLKLLVGQDDLFQQHGLDLSYGRYPLNENEIVLNENVLYYTNLDFQIGDTITLEIGKRVINSNEIMDRQYQAEFEQFLPSFDQTYRIVGFMDILPASVESFSEAGFTNLVYQSNQPLKQNIVLMELNDITPKSYQSLTRFLNNSDIEYVQTNLLETHYLGIESITQSPLYLMFLGGFLITILIGLAAVLVIWNAFSINNRHMMTQLGLLDGVGATNSQKQWILIFQALMLGIASIPIGLLAGYSVTSILLLLFRVPIGEYIFFDKVVIYLYPSLILIIVLLSLGAILFTAFFTTYRISNLSSIESIKYYDLKREKQSLLRIPTWFKSIESKLAFINYKKNRSYYRTLIMSLVVSIILIGTSVALVGSQQQSDSRSRRDVVYEFFRGELQDGQIINLIDELKENQAFTQAGLWQQFNLVINVETADLNPEVVAMNPSNDVYLVINIVDDDYCLNVLQTEYPDFDCMAHGLFIDHFQSEYLDENNELRTINNHLFNENHVIDFELNQQALILDLSSDRYHYLNVADEPDPTIYFSRTFFDYLSTPFTTYLKENAGYNVGLVNQIFVNGENANETESLFRQTLSRHGLDDLDRIENVKRLGLLENQVVQFFGLMSLSLVGLVIVIALSNVVNAINHNLSLRSKEFSVLISNGMTMDSYLKMIGLEISLFGGLAFLIGLPTSLLLSNLIIYLLDLSSPSFLFQLLIITFICVFLIVVVIVVALLISVLTIKNHNVSQLTKD